MPSTLLITGPRGFIGRHITAAALKKPHVRLRILARTAERPATGAQMDTVTADLGDPDSLRGLCEGVDAVVHCASAIDADASTLHAVNDVGTRALVEDAERHGVRRVVYVSTAAVYGHGTFHRADVADLRPAPESAASHTRAAAERHVLAAGGTVLRPHLVYGTGDRQVVPGLTWLLRYLGAAVDTPALHSAVNAADLARAAVAAALTDSDVTGAQHANHPTPLAVAELTALVLERLGLPPRPPLTPDQALARVRGDARARHHLTMLTHHHWFLGDTLWDRLGVDPGAAPALQIPDHLPPRPGPAPLSGDGRRRT
ncbi:NAD-dependent epimerase/dehydratase family protein [Streptomyces sp. NPDC005551]|uniref:NAD-dependent epimerase/dehydratase family protein n=1 Tax=unclassified Streptomyces TaxID=2593676 RepID=UPI0033FB8186